MNDQIENRWTDYCNQISETARRFTESSTSPNDEITAALNRFVNSDSPKSDAELGIRMGKGDQLQAEWRKKQDAYIGSDNHDSIPIPDQSMAEQAEMARQDVEEARDHCEG